MQKVAYRSRQFFAWGVRLRSTYCPSRPSQRLRGTRYVFDVGDCLLRECVAAAPPAKRGLHCPGLEEWGVGVFLLSALVGGGDAEKTHGGIGVSWIGLRFESGRWHYSLSSVRDRFFSVR